jgi:hypothetical protein
MRWLIVVSAVAAIAALVGGSVSFARPAGSGSQRVLGSPAVVDAEVLGVSTVRRSGGRRVVFVQLRTDERITAVVRVLRNGALVTRSRLFSIRPGRWVLSLPLSKEIAGGPARVAVWLKDRTGTVAIYRQPIRVPTGREDRAAVGRP